MLELGSKGWGVATLRSLPPSIRVQGSELEYNMNKTLYTQWPPKHCPNHHPTSNVNRTSINLEKNNYKQTKTVLPALQGTTKL